MLETILRVFYFWKHLTCPENFRFDDKISKIHIFGPKFEEWKSEFGGFLNITNLFTNKSKIEVIFSNIGGMESEILIFKFR